MGMGKPCLKQVTLKSIKFKYKLLQIQNEKNDTCSNNSSVCKITPTENEGCIENIKLCTSA